jgi:hypothetical protein
MTVINGLSLGKDLGKESGLSGQFPEEGDGLRAVSVARKTQIDTAARREQAMLDVTVMRDKELLMNRRRLLPHRSTGSGNGVFC